MIWPATFARSAGPPGGQNGRTDINIYINIYINNRSCTTRWARSRSPNYTYMYISCILLRIQVDSGQDWMDQRRSMPGHSWHTPSEKHSSLLWLGSRQNAIPTSSHCSHPVHCFLLVACCMDQQWKPGWL